MTASIMEPLTVQLTVEQLKKKSEQQKAKAPPPGTSRILSRATREHRKQQNKQQPKQIENPKPSGAPIKSNQPTNNQEAVVVQDLNQSTDQNADQIHKAADRSASVFDNEEVENLIEGLAQDETGKVWDDVMNDKATLQKIKKMLVHSQKLVNDAKIEGASNFRNLCQLVCGLYAFEFYSERESAEEAEFSAKILQVVENFSQELEIPTFFVELAEGFNKNQSSNLRKVCYTFLHLSKNINNLHGF